MNQSFTVVCSVMEAKLSNQQKDQLENEFLKNYQDVFGTSTRIKILWMSFPEGQAYVAGKPSSNPTMLAPVPDNTDQAKRSVFLYSLLESWVTLSGYKKDQVVISAADQSLADQFMKTNQQRVSSLKRPLMMAKIITRLIRSKIQVGRLESSINL
ncbi:hypothetical protein [Litoribacillus peritrichatus]|uniref:Uncharacterized protein n=1 Tax=Litoribacillus peritrichatus TaxID=718191 RepID=A0ABP7M984_9GAMM